MSKFLKLSSLGILLGFLVSCGDDATSPEPEEIDFSGGNVTLERLFNGLENNTATFIHEKASVDALLADTSSEVKGLYQDLKISEVIGQRSIKIVFTKVLNSVSVSYMGEDASGNVTAGLWEETELDTVNSEMMLKFPTSTCPWNKPCPPNGLPLKLKISKDYLFSVGTQFTELNYYTTPAVEIFKRVE